MISILEWLEGVYAELLFIFAILQLFLWIFTIISHWRMYIRLTSVELRHQALMERIMTNHTEIITLRRSSQEFPLDHFKNM